MLEALTRAQTLVIGYRDAADKLTRPVIHPQALLQRGPRVYLFAMKNDEALVRMYALHRITSSALGSEPARQAADFDLDREIHNGNADFGDGTLIGVVLRARGYVASLLRECRLSADQRIEDEDEDSDFELLGCGDKVQVIEPAELRTVMAAQTAKAARLYAQRSDG